MGTLTSRVKWHKTELFRTLPSHPGDQTMPLAGKAGAGTPRGDTGGTPRGDTQVASKQLNRGRKRAIGLLADSPVSAQYLGQFVFIWPRRGTCTYSVTSSVKQENTVSEWDWRENTTNPRLRIKRWNEWRNRMDWDQSQWVSQGSCSWEAFICDLLRMDLSLLYRGGQSRFALTIRK